MNYYITFRAYKHIVALLFLATLSGLIHGCRQENEVNPGFGPNGEPRILSVKIPDVPDQNIYINQDTKQITVTVPTSFSADEICPVYQFTPATRGSSPGPVYLLPIDGSSTVTLTTDAKVTNTYQYVFKPTGDLYFARLSAPVSYTVTKDNGNNDGVNTVCFSVYNYIDGEKTGTLVLTNKQTGKQLIFNQVGTHYSPCDGGKQRDGAVILNATFDRRTYYQPGDYTVELLKTNGRRVAMEQSFQLQRGIPTLYLGDNYGRPFQIGGPAYSLPGANILPDDKLTLRLIGRSLNPVTVQPTGLLAEQPGIQLPSLTGVSPGYYYAQVVLNGVDVPSYIRLTLVANPTDLVITNFLEVTTSGQYPVLDPSLSLDLPIYMYRGNMYEAQTNRSLYPVPTDNKTPRVRLTSVTDPSKDYYVSLNLNPADMSKLSYGTFTIPATTPSGRYQLSYQLVAPDQTVAATSIPLERDVVVQ